MDKPSRSLAARLASFLIHQSLALVVFVGFPAFVTGIAPVSWVHFTRHDDQVSATTQTCLLFLIPYKTTNVRSVVSIGDRIAQGTVTQERRSGQPNRRTKAEDEGFLVVQGENETVEVPVTPFNLESVVERSEAFLNDPQSTELRLFVVANWKFSIIAGGLVSLLTVLYVATLTIGGAIKLVHLFQWALGVPPEQRLLAKYMGGSNPPGSTGGQSRSAAS